MDASCSPLVYRVVLRFKQEQAASVALDDALPAHRTVSRHTNVARHHQLIRLDLLAAVMAGFIVISGDEVEACHLGLVSQPKGEGQHGSVFPLMAVIVRLWPSLPSTLFPAS